MKLRYVNEGATVVVTQLGRNSLWKGHEGFITNTKMKVGEDKYLFPSENCGYPLASLLAKTGIFLDTDTDVTVISTP